MDGALLLTFDDPALDAASEPVTASARPRKSPAESRRRRAWRIVGILVVLLGVAFVALAWFEARNSILQARELSGYARGLRYAVADGPSDAIVFPNDGPFDHRLGYARLPAFLARLAPRGFAIRTQARFSPSLVDHVRNGYFPPYAEKTQAGLSVDDASGASLYRFRYPDDGYAGFDSIPPLVVESLLFIENRDLLDDASPYANPAVDWPRFGTAIVLRLAKLAGVADRGGGGASTLATQLEKFRHSPDGLTLEGSDKLKQMFSASVRSYLHGERTLDARRAIVRDYLNSVPLSAAPGIGEVNGLAGGLRAWYGADFAAVNRALDVRTASTVTLEERAVALREVLGLILAQRRPSYYLGAGRAPLEKLVDAHLRLLAREGIIDTNLRDATLAQPLRFADATAPGVRDSTTFKTTHLARAHLATLLDVPLYELDRLDLAASTTLDASLQDAVAAHLKKLADPEFARAMGLYGDHLLSAKPEDVRYTFTLLEMSDDGYRVRAQTDTNGQLFDLNEGSKLELGSTAKLRVLATYLEIVAELHDRYAGKSAAELRALELPADDALSHWAADYLAVAADRSLAPMLAAALERRYSASPYETFFTGGGVHTFANFKPEDNGREPTLREAFRESINLPFIRLLRDVVRYTTRQTPGNTAQLLADDDSPRRAELLARFADREGQTFLRRFWKRNEGKSREERVRAFFDGLHASAPRLAAAQRYLAPNTTPAAFGDFLRASLPGAKLDDQRVDELYRAYTPGRYSLTDQAYVAGVHPLELWLLNFELQRPRASYADAVAASEAARQEVYGWLFKSRHKAARDSRLATMLEVEAFLEIHRRWQALGYPFERLVPSLATAIGSSGDRPAALAELIGIIRNDGVRMPTVRVDRLAFARGTPYETTLEHEGRGTRVMRPEIAAALRGALDEVVALGTARRLQGAFIGASGKPLEVGGKTGTGDNRVESVDRFGVTRDSKAINRTATFVFYLGERHFGTITAYVAGREADGYGFTSALPVQVLKGLAPLLMPYVERSDAAYAARTPARIEIAASP